MRHARNQAQHAEDAGGEAEHARRGQQLLNDLLADVVFAAHARDHHRRSHRDQQARNLRDQRIAHGQQHIGIRRLARRQAVLQHADGEAADDADDQDQDAGDGVAAHELRRAVHRAEEVGFFRHFEAAAAGFLLVDVAGAQVGVDRHLLARHRVEREAGRNLGDALRAFRNHDEIDHHQDREHDQADREVAADQEVAEGLDHRARRARAGMAFEQHHAGRSHVERQAHQRGQQQHAREGGEVERPHHVGGNHHHHQRDRDVEREERVEQPRRNRQHHQREDRHHQERRGGALEHGAVGAQPLAGRGEVRVHGLAAFAVELDLAVLFSGSSSGGT